MTATSTADNTLDKIREAYADAARDQPADYPPLPAWFELPIEMRKAIIRVFASGRRNAMEEAWRRRVEKDRLTA